MRPYTLGRRMPYWGWQAMRSEKSYQRALAYREVVRNTPLPVRSRDSRPPSTPLNTLLATTASPKAEDGVMGGAPSAAHSVIMLPMAQKAAASKPGAAARGPS